jgi:hypothetical protein
MTQELNWYTTYNLPLTIGNQSRINDYVNKLLNKSSDKTVETKITQIEKEYQNKLKEIEDLCLNKDAVLLLKSKSSLIILQKELDIIKLLTKYTLQNKILNYDFFMDCLSILLELSETLRIKIDQKEINHDKVDTKTGRSFIKIEGSITRCSYKFCSYQDSCTYNYNLKTKSLCYQDHYVHNMVSADLKILLDYINQKSDKTQIILHNKEILKTINTLSFVIGHMENELRTKCLYIPENEWESCHIVKNK